MLYHETLYDFSAAFDLTREWHVRHPGDLSAQAEFAERHFSTGRYSEAKTCVTDLLTNPKIDPRIRIPLQAIEIATLLVLNDNKMIPQKLEQLRAIAAGQLHDFRRRWTFWGSKDFIGTTVQPILRRDWLLALFAALEAKNRNAILTALETLHAKLSTLKPEA